MNPSVRSSHPSRVQIEALLDFLKKNPSLAKGFSKVPSARCATKTNWQRLAIRLNSMGGSIKTWKQWTKYWADKKSAVKKKAALRSASRRKTGGGHEEVVELTEIEEQILTVMGGEGFASGDRHLAIDPFEISLSESSPPVPESSPPVPESSQSALGSPLAQDVPVVIEILETSTVASAGAAVAAIDVPVSLHTETNLQCIAGTSYASNRPSYVLSMPVVSPDHSGATMAGPLIVQPSQDAVSPSTSQPQQTGTSREFSPTNRTQIPPRMTTPRRRRRVAQTLMSPPSQRQSQFTSITERFLRVEEQRLELNQRQTAMIDRMLERNSARDHMLAQAFTSIGESLKLLAEAINKK